MAEGLEEILPAPQKLIDRGKIPEDSFYIHIRSMPHGVAYLLYLAWEIAVSRPSEQLSESASRPIGFVQAAAFSYWNAWTR